MHRVCVIGSGYVGLVAGACLADFGNHVTCLDVDEDKISILKSGRIPFYEPGLEELVERNVNRGRLEFSTEPGPSISDAEVIVLAVGTPPDDSGDVDLSYVEEAAGQVARNLSGYKVVIQKSTVPVGTCEKIKKWIEQAAPGGKVDVVSNPEFLREGSAVEDFMSPDRVIIGADSKDALEVIESMYAPLYSNNVPFLQTDVRTAELIKYASNAFLASKISFINDVANLCEKIGADVEIVAKGLGYDTRIGPQFLRAGAGFGGSCFPKDTQALLKMGEKHGTAMRVVEAAVKTNQEQREKMLEKIVDGASGDIEGKTVGMLGLSFKPNTDDIRESPALFVAEKLLAMDVEVRAYDPVAMKNAASILPELTYCSDVYDAAVGCEVLALFTEWNEFKNVDFHKLASVMAGRSIVDCRNVWEAHEVEDAGFDYEGVGRGRSQKRTRISEKEKP
jgi:UDPglucose 6-dehydrogenase